MKNYLGLILSVAACIFFLVSGIMELVNGKIVSGLVLIFAGIIFLLLGFTSVERNKKLAQELEKKKSESRGKKSGQTGSGKSGKSNKKKGKKKKHK